MSWMSGASSSLLPSKRENTTLIGGATLGHTELLPAEPGHAHPAPGTAYGVWVGIGAVGAALAGMVLFEEQTSTLLIISVLLVVAGIVGLKVSSTA